MCVRQRSSPVKVEPATGPHLGAARAAAAATPPHRRVAAAGPCLPAGAPWHSSRAPQQWLEQWRGQQQRPFAPLKHLRRRRGPRAQQQLAPWSASTPRASSSACRSCTMRGARQARDDRGRGSLGPPPPLPGRAGAPASCLGPASRASAAPAAGRRRRRLPPPTPAPTPFRRTAACLPMPPRWRWWRAV